MSNIVKAVFNGSRSVTTTSIYAEKYGQILEIEGLDLPATFEVDFCNDGDCSTTQQIGTENRVKIPDIYLKSCRSVKAYIFLHTGSSDGGTEYEVIIPLKPRPEHTEDEPTPVEHGAITDAIAALNAGVQQANEEAEEAEAWATGTRNGVDVPDTDPTYHNNAKWYAENSASRKELDDLRGQVASDAVTITKRVDGGTQITNAFFAQYLAAQVGFYYSIDETKLYIYTICINNYGYSTNYTVRHYRLFEKNSVEEPYEFTLENAPSISEYSTTLHGYKSRVAYNNAADGYVLDLRLCSIAYDENNNEVARIYSSQYRYTISDGVCTRTIVPVETTSASHITNIGLWKFSNSAYEEYTNIWTSTDENCVLPIVSTNQTTQYKFIIPDEWFDDAPYGFAIATVMGNGNIYVGAPIHKAVEYTKKEEQDVINNDYNEKLTRLFGTYSGIGAVKTQKIDGGIKILNGFFLNRVLL